MPLAACGGGLRMAGTPAGQAAAPPLSAQRSVELLQRRRARAQVALGELVERRVHRVEMSV
jgi:hypothetical protein